MKSLSRVLLPASLLAMVSVLAGGCGSARSGTSGAAPALSHSPSAPAPARSQGSASRSATAARAPAQATPPAVGAVKGPGATVYLAEGASLTGKMLHAPSCKAGCQLSGDSTAWLLNMTWPTWNSTVAVGKGTEQLDDCNPDCAQAALHAVPVAITLSRPVMVCVDGKGTWFWTRASFTWPAGLPAAFHGAGAPVNPFDYPGIAAAAARSC